MAVLAVQFAAFWTGVLDTAGLIAAAFAVFPRAAPPEAPKPPEVQTAL